MEFLKLFLTYYLSILRRVSIHIILQETELFVFNKIDRDMSSLHGTKLSWKTINSNS